MFNVNTIVSGLSSPVGMAFIPDNGPGKDGSGNFMVIEQNGTVIVVKNNGGTFTKQSVPFVKVPNVQVFADAGLLGIAFDPNWVNTKLVYFYSTLNVTGVIKNEVFRYHTTTDSSGNIIADTSVGQQIIVDKIPADVDHDGGHMKFDSQGNLYISTGDNYGYTASQDLTSLAGKLLKITPLASPGSNGLLYSIPSTNPFAANPNSSIRKEIYSYGVRNTFNFDIDPQTGKIYFDHVGQSAWESIVDTTNPINFGWSNYEGPTVGNPQNATNYKEPLYWYPHQGLEPTTGFAKDLEAITGGAFYYGSTYPSNLQGAYFFGDYGAGYISALLSTDKNPPQIDPVTGVPKGQVQTIVSGLTLAPTDMQVWNGKIYYVNLTGSIAVLNYS
jgi:glucose/arabinose dehydrogenase